MIKRIIYKLLKRRHYWRYAGFDELSELYISMIFRSVAIGSIGVFVPIYLHNLGYTLASILSVYGWFAWSQAIGSYGTAYLVARFGPKHIITVSYFVQLVSSLLFLTQGHMRWPVMMLGVVWGIAANLFFIPYHVDFSKIKHVDHAGKEVGYMYIMQKVGFTIGPVLGGIAATIFGAQYVFLIACLLLFLGAMPLLATREPVRTRQTLDFNGFPLHKAGRDLFAYAALATEDTLTKLLWPTYIGIFILGVGVYAKLGILSSVSVAFSIFATYVFGKLADRRRGRDMIRWCVSVNALIHLMRPFVHTFAQTVGVNFANDAVTVGYTVPFVKGMYAAADDLPGHRIVYLASMEMMGNIWRGVLCWLLVVLTGVLPDRATLTAGFVAAALASVLIAAEKFGALDRHRL